LIGILLGAEYRFLAIPSRPAGTVLPGSAVAQFGAARLIRPTATWIVRAFIAATSADKWDEYPSLPLIKCIAGNND
jgi:hypothetical protein